MEEMESLRELIFSWKNEASESANGLETAGESYMNYMIVIPQMTFRGQWSNPEHIEVEY